MPTNKPYILRNFLPTGLLILIGLTIIILNKIVLFKVNFIKSIKLLLISPYIPKVSVYPIIVNKKDKVLESKKRKDNCSNCGLCYTLCPWHINPLKTNNCYNCGLCNYVCPSKRVLRLGDSDV